MNYELVELMFRKSLAVDKAVVIADELAHEFAEQKAKQLGVEVLK